jgi:hypothetical protein
MAWPIGVRLPRPPPRDVPPPDDEALRALPRDPPEDERPDPPRLPEPPRVDDRLVFFAALPRDCEPEAFLLVLRPCEPLRARVLVLPLDLRVRVAFMSCLSDDGRCAGRYAKSMPPSQRIPPHDPRRGERARNVLVSPSRAA